MASRVLLLIVLFTVGLSVRRSEGLEVGLQFSQEPHSVVVGRHRSLLLPCASPTPNVSYLWTLNDQPINLVNNSRIQLLNNGSLYFKKVVHKKGQSDQGMYRCIIRSAVGALASSPALLQPAWIHEFTEGGSIRSLSVVEGQPALISCSIESQPPALISWQIQDHPVPQTDKYIFLKNGSFIIKSVEKEDQGEYRCTAYNSLANKTRISEPLSLTVADSETVGLEIIQPSVNLKMNWTKGEEVEVACVARGNPTPLVKWTKLLPDQSSTLVTNAKEGVSVLTVDSVTDGHLGTYTCVASQTVVNRKTNTISVTKELTVEQVLSAPVITKKPKSEVFLTAKTVRFQCEAEGSPPPTIVWYKNGERLVINGRIKLRKSELVLSNTISSDSGLYQCVAGNTQGEVWASARLSVNRSRDQPRPPSHVTCTTLSSSTVSLTWQQQSDVHTEFTAFTIHCLFTDKRSEDERIALQDMAVDQLNQTMVIDKLSPYTNYTCYVRSYNHHAASDNSSYVICQTGESVPVGVPEVSVKTQGATAAVVEWTPLLSHIAQGEVSEYKVQWRKEKHPSIHVDTVSGDVTRYLITGLSPQTEYEVRVLAATKKGWPILAEHEMPWSLVTTASISDFHPLVPPPSMQLTVLNDTTIQVRWTMLESAAKVQGFRLSYRKRNSSPSPPIELSSDSSEFLLSDLDAQTWYEVQLRAVSADAESEVSLKQVLTLPASQSSITHAPAPPSNLEATPTSAHSIHLAWDPPPPPDNVSFYIVSYNVVASTITTSTSNNSYIKSTNGEVVVSGLRPFTLYEMRVRSHDESNRYSEYSQAVECRTLEGVAEKVTDIDYKPYNSNAVRLMWKPPEVVNGIVTGYNIAYTRLPSTPQNTWTNITFMGTKQSANVTGLQPNVDYYMVIRAINAAGPGAPSKFIKVLIPAREKAPAVAPPSTTPTPTHAIDQLLGILLGCIIGVVLCGVSLVYRRKCYKPGHSCRATSANGGPCFHSASENHEMLSLPTHLDTKGAHPNGEANGLKLPLLSNGRVPNAVVTRDRNVRITENPQFDCGVTISCEELRQPSDEGDSLLSGHSLNDTQLTNITCNSTPHNTSDHKHDPDDGFHESQQPVVGPNG